MDRLHFSSVGDPEWRATSDFDICLHHSVSQFSVPPCCEALGYSWPLCSNIDLIFTILFFFRLSKGEKLDKCNFQNQQHGECRKGTEGAPCCKHTWQTCSSSCRGVCRLELDHPFLLARRVGSVCHSSEVKTTLKHIFILKKKKGEQKPWTWTWLAPGKSDLNHWSHC